MANFAIKKLDLFLMKIGKGLVITRKLDKGQVFGLFHQDEGMGSIVHCNANRKQVSIKSKKMQREKGRNAKSKISG